MRRPPRRRTAVAPVVAAPAEPKPYVPSPEFAAASLRPHNEVGPIISRWNERGIAEWLLPVNAGRCVGGIPAHTAEGNLTMPYKDPQKRREAQRKYREAIEEKARAYLEAKRERAKERKAAPNRRKKPDDETV